MIFKKHNNNLYNTLLSLSRNIFFYKDIKLQDSFESRIYLMFIHFSLMLIIFKKKKKKFPQVSYDSLFHSIENNIRELGYGDVSVNKKMKEYNKILYDILLKIEVTTSNKFQINKELINKYFQDLKGLESEKYHNFEDYFLNFYNFCFELSPDNMIREAINFKN
tara:strand:+ start:114 stop:605 length:492 start_codon:yes stop_codon:yes gene_type:complete